MFSRIITNFRNNFLEIEIDCEAYLSETLVNESVL